LTEAIEHHEGIQEFEKTLHGLEANVGSAIAQTCGAVTGSITTLATAGDQLCTTVHCMTSLATAMSEDGQGFLSMLSEPVTNLVGEAVDKLSKYVYTNALKPLAVKLVAIIKSIVSSGVQALLGLCGLFPEVGAAICSSFLMPLTWAVDNSVTALFDWQIDKLYKKASKALKKMVATPIAEYLLDQVKPLLEASTGAIEAVQETGESVSDAIDDGSTMVAHSGDWFETHMSKATSDVQRAMGADTAMIVKLLMPMATKMLGALVPSTTQAIKDCTKKVGDLQTLVKTFACKDDIPKERCVEMMAQSAERHGEETARRAIANASRTR